MIICLGPICFPVWHLLPVLIFLWSRIRSIAGVSDHDEVRLRHLYFEDFLEALVRLATVIPLPTDEMLVEAEMTHAGMFMYTNVEMSADNTTLDCMLADQACEWGGVPDATLAGPMPRRLEMLLDVIVRKIKQPNVQDDEPLTPLTRKEVRFFLLKSLGCAEAMCPENWTKEKQVGEEK